MTRKLLIPTIFIVLTTLFGCGQNSRSETEVIEKIEMNLSAFGVESDSFPSIEADIDFTKGTSVCVKSYYNPEYKGSTYSLSKTEMTKIIHLLKISDVQKLKPEYNVTMPDQPSSRAVIYTTHAKYEINDYGLEGDYPLKELYRIVYKF
ncbi:DUF6438 domain-containing protein [Flavobacterium pedocola]